MSDATNNWNATILADFRAHEGRITEGRLKGATLLLLTTTGAKTGEPRTAFLGYHMDGGRFIVVGSNQGRDEHPFWLENVRRNPIVTVELGTEKLGQGHDHRGSRMASAARRSHRGSAPIRRVSADDQTRVARSRARTPR